MPSPHDGPARRGRRDPQLAAQLQEGPTLDIDLDAAGDPEQGEQLPETEFVFSGDIISGKVSIAPRVAGTESWVTYGMVTRVGPDETEESTYHRVATVVTNRVLDLADELEERIQDEQNRKAEEIRNTPIRPRR